MRRAAALLAAVALLTTAPGVARAAPTDGALGPITPQVQPSTATTAADPNVLTTPPSPSIAPPGHRLTARQAIAIANAAPKIAALRRERRGEYAEAYLKGTTQWQVSVFDDRGDGTRAELGQVLIDDLTGAVLETWTGHQVAWTMARGYDGAFGREVNAWYVWVPFCVLFVAPFLPWRRRPSWLHLDLLALLGFSVSLAFFNGGRIDLSVPLVYPLLAYLLVRMLLVGLRGARARPAPLRLLVPVSWLAIALVFLVGFRVGLNVASSNVVDVGYSGVIGANRLMEGTSLYGTWPRDNAYGDTYGPVNYYAYVPFERTFGWSGRWDDLPAAHGAAIAFDLLTLLLLFLLGRRIRGPSLGIVLAYAWASFPFTLYASNTNSNDALVALLLVATLLVAARPAARGAFAALAGLTKLAPLGLVPLLARTPHDGARPRRGGPRALLAFAVAFALTAGLALLPMILGGDLRTFWDHSIAFQRERDSPFSIWGLWGGLDAVQLGVQVGAVLLALALAFVPRRPTLVQVAALGAAVLIALQLGVTHWFYLYVVWFFPLVMVALLGRAAGPPEDSAEAGRGRHEQLLDPIGAPG